MFDGTSKTALQLDSCEDDTIFRSSTVSMQMRSASNLSVRRNKVLTQQGQLSHLEMHTACHTITFKLKITDSGNTDQVNTAVRARLPLLSLVISQMALQGGQGHKRGAHSIGAQSGCVALMSAVQSL
jgi:hypothetical protein